MLRYVGLSALTVVLASACALRGTGQSEDTAKQTDACTECQHVLVACASTSSTEQDFLLCRAQWQQCQSARGILVGECQNPSDADACSLCRTRLSECSAAAGDDGALCEEQFGVCKSLLMTRSDLMMECGAHAPNPDATCGICRDDFVACVSDASAENIGICEPKLDQCLAGYALDAAVCPVPVDDEACELCKLHHAACVASGELTCDDDLAACAKKLAPTCDVLTGGQGGGGQGGGGQGGDDAGGGGQGGAGGQAPTCAHDVCEEGDALTSDCSACATDVCAADSFCCDESWDALCVESAAQLCGC